MKILQLNWGLIFATAQMALCGVASVAYLAQKDWRHSLYWALAAAITALVTWGFH